MSQTTLPPRSTGLVIVESAVAFLLTFMALIGNSLILAALYRNPRLRNTTNIYIAALAVTDLLNASIPGMLFTSSIISGKLVFSTLGCRISGYLLHYLTYVSITTMALTAVNRYFRVVKPQHFNKLFGFKRSLTILGVLWLLVAAFVLYPQVFSQAEFSFNPISAFCAYRFYSQFSETVFSAFVVGIFVLLNFSLISWSYYRVSRAIRQHNNGVFSSLHGVTAKELNLTKVLFVLVLAFALCWLPTFGVILIVRFTFGGRAPHLLGVVIPFLIQTASAVNPLIYGVMSPPFRKEFKQLLLFKREDQSESEVQLFHRLRVAPSRHHDIARQGRVRPKPEAARTWQSLTVCDI